MQGQLSQKERMLLEDLKSSEDLCVIKYNNYAQQAQDPQLSQLFTKLANEEHKHYDTVNQLLQSGGKVSGQPKQGGQSGQQNQGGTQQGQAGQGQGNNQMNQSSGLVNLNQMGSGSNSSDKYLLQDMLSTEKYVSSAYDTSVFESSNTNIRQALQHIQQDEQNHGEQIYQYMSSHGMYQAQ